MSSGAVSQGTRLQGTKLQGTKLQGCKLQGTKLQGTKLQGCKLQGTALSGQELVAPGYEASLDACTAPTSGITRDCGWQLGGVGTCAPGQSVTVGAGCGGLGSSTGDSMIRVCADQAACGPGSAGELAESDDVCGMLPSATFTCPSSGSYTVLVASKSSDATDTISPAASAGSFPLTTPIVGSAFIGTTLQGIDQNGAPFDILIGDIQTDPTDPSGEILLYTLLAKDTGGTWQNICETDADGVAQATFVAGTWDDTGAHHSDPDMVTVACTVGVIAKCTRWGYKPWKTVNGVPLADYHQACTRMARADYCGDGVTHTEDGTLIDVWDSVPIQTQDPVLLMLYEASWTPGGAYCLSKGRWNLDGVTILLECPQKVVLPSLTDLLNGCLFKLTSEPRANIKTNNLSYLQVHLLDLLKITL